MAPVAEQEKEPAVNKQPYRRALPLRWHLVLLVAGTLLPLVIFTFVVVYRLSRAERVVTERRLMQRARTMAVAVENEEVSTVHTLQAISESEELDRGDFEAFYNEAKRAVKSQPGWTDVVLLTPDGHKIFDTWYPFGTKLHPVYDPGSFKQVVASHQPVVGDMAYGGGEWAFPIRIPALRDGKLKYVITAVVTPRAILDIITSQGRAEGEWTRGVVDGNGRIVARSRDNEKYVGKSVTAGFLQRRDQQREEIYRDITLDGKPVYGAYSHIGSSRWTAGISVSVEQLEAPARRAMAAVLILGLLVLLLSIGGAILLSNRIAGAMASASAAAAALSQGELQRVQHGGIREVAVLGKALRTSGKLLEQRERERDLNLVRAESARLEAENANRLKDEFLATVSHELRTPLTAILGWSHLARDERHDADTIRRALETIERNGRSLASLVDDLLDMSRIITGTLRVEMQPAELNKVIMNAIDSVRPTAAAKGVELTTDIGEANYVRGDPNRLQQVVWNLLTNAIKFTPAGGKVEVQLMTSPGHVEIAVCDTGVGIDPEFLPYVFERFRQADSSNTRKFGGLGLGLAIVRHLIEQHGGSVRAISEGEGKGATFLIRLPSIPAPQSDASASYGQAGDDERSVDADPHLLSGARILVLDDEMDARLLVTAILAGQGAEVHSCASAAEALHEIRQWTPNLIVSDIGMPQQDGYDFIRLVRQSDSEISAIPAIALTAYAHREDKIKVLAAGYQAHLAKPVEPEELTAVVVGLLTGKL